MKELLAQIEKASRRILLVGDLMLDSYIKGSIDRISPEAPVPVLKEQNQRKVPGGAGNVALNLAGLNSQVRVCGLIGEDSQAKDLEKLLDQAGVSLEGHRIEKRPTTVKTRVVSSNQQLLRLDREVCTPMTEKEADELKTKLNEILQDELPQGILLSDYDKGTLHPTICQELIVFAAEKEIPMVIDPKGKDWKKYRGAFLLTPNIKEMSIIVDRPLANQDKDLIEAAREVMQRYDIKNILITRSEKGMTLVDQRGSIFHLATEAREVFDVSGAGDTVAATLLRGLIEEMDLPRAAALANRAAALVVAHHGTYPVKLSELSKSLKAQSADAVQSIPENEIDGILTDLKGRGLSLVFTNGCFDILHRGHLRYLKAARALGDRLIVGLNSDASVKRLKGTDRPVNDQQSRAEMLLALRFVDHVILFEEDTPKELIKRVKPNVLVKGGDYKIEDIVGREYADKTCTIPFEEGFSTTSIIERIQK